MPYPHTSKVGDSLLKHASSSHQCASQVGSSTAYHAIPWTACCHLNPSLPKELVGHVRSRPAPPSMYQLRAAGLQPGPEGDSTQAIHLRVITRLEELRHRTFYPYLWEKFWSIVKQLKAFVPFL
ncbi:hypothetical protein DUNSADRAFT_1378 [Dunaliella salina]|uniref:Encoded protein n=1 Tax=Dunaliella salina TaxID=3046 RepID=A0ABQ7FXL0_DUNSA|nr:hypothetical protein DUNSADRAFT_1378 [Dunaliella salina]|eukprot:KAF5827079.1 hypothetical protein DUNSADRAFT_1378 [Dunaliella salina]